MTKERMFRGLAVLVVAFVAVAVVTALARRGSKEGSPMQDLNSTEQLKQRFQQDTAKVVLITGTGGVWVASRRRPLRDKVQRLSGATLRLMPTTRRSNSYVAPAVR